jgi:hypothetical protein
MDRINMPGLKIEIIDSARRDENGKRISRKKQIQLACKYKGPMVLIVNYEVSRDFPALLQKKFKPDLHIIDEVDNLRRGTDTERAPKIFSIESKYRIAISARPILTRLADLVAPLAWVC